MTTGISTPTALPPFRAAGHGRAPLPAVQAVTMDAGPVRLRRQYTSPQQTSDVALYLDQAGFDTWDEWFETTLQAGALSFNAALASPEQSSGIQWWECRFVEPYRADYAAGNRWRVSARLRLLGGPYDGRPAPGTLAAEAASAATADAALTVTRNLAADASAAGTADAALA